MKVSITPCDNYDEELVYHAVKTAIQNCGFQIKPSIRVLIKPNVLGQHKPEECITTHPTVISAIVQVFKEHNCEVIIAESSGFYQQGGTNRALEISGITTVAEKYKIKLVNLESVPIKKIDDASAKAYKNPEISSLLYDVDLVVNAPKLKTHSLMKYTGAVKNLYGTIPGGRKQKLHVVGQTEEDFGNILVDIYQNIKPGLTIMDAVIGLEGNGPGTGGVPKKTGLILACKSAPALDYIASQIIGYKPMEIVTTRYCVDRGLLDVKSVEIIGEMKIVHYKKPMLNSTRVPKPLLKWIMNKAVVKPYAITDKCKKCGKCATICPAQVIELKPYPVFDYSKCISCYCCHETCPYNAMDFKTSTSIEILRKVKNTVGSVLIKIKGKK